MLYYLIRQFDIEDEDGTVLSQGFVVIDPAEGPWVTLWPEDFIIYVAM